jgi:hypothetical protein
MKVIGWAGFLGAWLLVAGPARRIITAGGAGPLSA